MKGEKKMKKKMKKVLSAGLTLALVAMNAVVPVNAADTYADYVRGEMPANLIPDSTAGGGYKYFGTVYGNVDYGSWYTHDSEIDGYKFKYFYKGTDAPLENGDAWAAFAGFFLNRNHGSGENLEGNFGFVAEEGKSYVFKANVQNASEEGVAPYFGMAFNNRWDDSNLVGSVEYGLSGMQLEDGWKEYKATYKMPEGYVSGKYNGDYLDTPIVGLAEGSPVGSAVWIDVSEKDSVYFAEEQVYDIKNSLDKSVVYRGETITAKAELVNQLDIPGSLEQEFEWKVVNADRSAVVEIPLKVSEDTTEAYITPGSAVEPGEYVILAYSDENGGMYKGAEFTVGEGTYYADFKTPEMNENLIPDSTAGGGFMYFGTRISKAEYSNFYTSTEGVANAFKYYYTETGDLTLTNPWGGFEGFFMNRNRGDGQGNFGFVAEAGTNYVFKANVKNASTNGAVPSFGIAMNGTYGPANIITTKEYGINGMALSDEWQEFKGTLVLPADFSDQTGYGSNPMAGFAAGAPEGSAFWLDVSEKDSVYFAKEQMYEFKNTLDKAEVLRGESVTANAENFNQLGIPGGLSQDFEWFVVNEDRKTINENFVIVQDGAVATVKPMYNVNPGKYILIAHSTAYDKNMGAEFEVMEGALYEDYAPTVKNENLLPDATQSTWFTNRNNGSIDNSDWFTYDEALGGNAFKLYYGGAGAFSLEAGWRGFEGMEFNSTQLGDKMWFKPEAGKSYVVSMNLKNASPEGVTPYFGAAINGTYGPANIVTTSYGTNGIAVGNEWTKFEGTLEIPDSFTVDTPFGEAIFVGFANGTPEGSAVWYDISHKDATYIAEEQAFDLTVETANETANSIDLKATLKNQLGYEGGLSQEFDWVAVKEDRKTVVDAITFEENGSSADVTASWDASLETGTYILVATSKDGGLVKTTSISVVRDLNDKINTIPENLIPDASAGSGWTYFNHRNNSTVDSAQGIADEKSPLNIKYFTTGEVTGVEGWRIFGGIELNSAQLGENKYFAPVAGKTYVLKAKLKDVSENGAKSYFGASMTYGYNPDNLVYTNEYGSKGMLVGSDWTDFNATITLPESFDVTAAVGDMISVGLANGTAAGAAYLMDVSTKDSVYLAEEKPYMVKLSTDKVTELDEGTVIDVKAEVVNQAEIPGTLKQDLKWYVVNAERTETVSGVTVEAYEGGAKVTINDAAVEDIRIVAVSSEYDLITGINPVKTASDDIKTLYVSTSGNDGADGETAPLATLEGARNRIRNIKNEGFEGSFEVIFEGGKYYFDNTVEFTSADSGVKGNEVTYKAADGEEVIFTGATQIDLSKAQKVTDEAILSRINDDAEDNIVAIDLTEQGYQSIAGDVIRASYGEIGAGYEYPGLYLNGKEQTLAQWPNGYNEYSTWSYVDKDTFGYSDAEPSKWASAEDWWIGGYMDYDYSYSRMPGVSVDTANKQINVATTADVFIDNSKTDKTYRWKAFNLLEELDAPTEWYIDRDNNILYYYMPELKEGSVLEISELKSNMVKLNQADYINFEGITFENTRSNAISATNVEDVIITGCTFENIGIDALNVTGTEKALTDKDFWQVNYIDASYDFEVSDNKFNNIGGHAIYMNGGNVDTLTPSGNVIKNNIIYKAGNIIKNTDVVEIWGCGISVIHNNISCIPDQAIRHYGNDHIIQYNEIHDVVQDADDAGAIYGGRNTIQRGTEISYNYIHDIFGTFDAVFGHKPAIYWDDYQTGMYAHHNIIKNAMINVYTNGIDNNYSYNTSIGITGKNIEFKNGGASSNAEPATGATFASTIADEELYYSKYPTLSTILGTYGSDLKNRKLSGLNTIKGNLSVSSVSGNSIGEYTNYPNATMIGSVVINKGTKNANVSGNTDNGTANFVNAAGQDYRIVGTGDLSSSVLNESFDINLIGVQSENTIDNTLELAYPANKGNVNSDTVKFAWYDAFGATNYTIEVATDANFANVIAKENVNYNFAEIPVPANGGVYYWKVTAHNTSREFVSDWTSAVYSFENGEKISVSASVNSDNTISLSITNNYYADAIAANVYVAEYDVNGALLSAQVVNETLTYQTAVDFAENNIKVQNPTTAVNIKVFIWNTDNKPLKDAVILK